MKLFTSPIFSITHRMRWGCCHSSVPRPLTSVQFWRPQSLEGFFRYSGRLFKLAVSLIHFDPCSFLDARNCFYLLLRFTFLSTAVTRSFCSFQAPEQSRSSIKKKGTCCGCPKFNGLATYISIVLIQMAVLGNTSFSDMRLSQGVEASRLAIFSCTWHLRC